MANSDSDSDLSDNEVSQDILERLNAYGNSLLDDEGRKKAKVKKSKKSKSNINPSNSTISSVSNESKSSKKKKKKKIDDSGEHHDETDLLKDFPKMSHVEKLKSMLSLTDEKVAQLKEKKLGLDSSKRDTTLDPVMTDANRLKRKKRPPPEVIVFEDPARRAKKPKKLHIKPKRQQEEEEEDEDDEEGGEEFDLKKARWDVRQMGIKALGKQEKEEAQIALAIKLGAKPPKKECLNYKELMEKRKMERLDDTERKEMMRKLGYKVPKAVDPKRRKRDINDVGRLDGQVGKFKFGVQKVSRTEIGQINKPKSGRKK